MVPKLYSILNSPPVRAVLICAKALEVQLDIIPMSLFDREQYKEDFLKKNPQHTVPVLEDDDGFIVTDSHAIMGYLVAKYGKDDALYPKDDYKQRAIIDHRLHFDTGILFIRGLAVARPVLYQRKHPTQEQLDPLREAFQILEQILTNNKTDYIAGNNLSIADFSIFATVTSWNIIYLIKISQTLGPMLKDSGNYHVVKQIKKDWNGTIIWLKLNYNSSFYNI